MRGSDENDNFAVAFECAKIERHHPTGIRIDVQTATHGANTPGLYLQSVFSSADEVR